jgi:spermidine synthase
MPWTLIESVTENDALLELYGKDGKFMIRANGLELMNGFCHESETALGHLAARFAPLHPPRILVGGLGLGYTVAALLDALGEKGSVTVAELSSAVINWFHRYMKPSVLPAARSNLRFVHTDVTDLLTAGHRYDVIVLDVDNGPEPLVTAGNAALYSPTGLSALHSCLSEDGVALLWSGFESTAFAARAQQAGFVVTCEPFQRARADLSHYVYVLAKRKAALRQFA